ncbi:MAG TPA: TonB-dependent receptor [Puia sp.]|jgi:TonB-linked SusC/RagA family outer membrane protein|nr:TonB-dependent receptor [Puia sp.]
MRKLLFFLSCVLLLIGGAAAQNRVVTGKVTDASGNPIPSASVVVKGSKRGTNTGQDGSFKLNVPPTARTLVISSIGFATMEVSIEGVNDVPVQLAAAARNDLQDVVVVGYGTQRKRDLTGAVYKLKDSTMNDVPIQGPDQALRGKVPGVQVTQSSGTPGSSISVLIRGSGTITTSNQPLYVVDGVILNTGSYSQLDINMGGQTLNVLSDINPNDIESYEILKDAAAAAIYGSRGANGVVLITTKKGANQKTKVMLDASLGTQSAWRKVPTLTGPQYVSLIDEETQAGFGATPSQIGLQNLGNAPDTYPTTNWQDLIFKNKPLFNYQLSVAGGDAKTKIYASANYTGDDGILIGSDYHRYGARINIDHTVNSRFKVSGEMAASRSIQNRINNDNNIYGVLSTAVLMPTYFKPYNPDGTYAYDANLGIIENPIASGKLRFNQAKTNRVVGDMAAEYFFLPTLSLRVQGSVDYVGFNEFQFLPSNTLEGATGPNGIGRQGYSSDLNLLNENVLTWKQSFGDHNITATAVASYQTDNFQSIYGEGHNFPGNGIQELSAASTPVTVTSSQTSLGQIGYLLRVNYDYKGRYLLSGSVRRDGSSALGSNFQYGTFPAVSAGWRISDEDFFKDVKTISNLKLRASYGKLGNTNGLNPYASKPLVGVGTNYVLNGNANTPGLAPLQIGNDSLRWESLKQADVGLEIGLFKERLQFTVDYYNKQTTDLLLARPLVASSGFTSVNQNIGEISNTGWEFSVTATEFATRDFVWTTSFNISFNKNIVKKISGSPFPSGFASWTQEGYPIGSFYGYKAIGLFNSQAEIDKAPTQFQGTAPGDIRFADLNHDGAITSADQTIIGNANPKYYGGLTNTFSYKGIDLTVFFQFNEGNKIYNENRVFAEGMNSLFGQYATTLKRWEPTDTNTSMPRAVFGDPNGNAALNSTRFLEDGSFIRLKNIILAYNLPRSVIEKTKLSSVKFFFQATNLKTWTKYSGFDPEVSTFTSTNPANNVSPGTDFLTYPQAKSWTFGLDLGF